MISNSVKHLRSYTNTAIADIAGNSPRSRISPPRRLRIERRKPPMSPHLAPISSYQMSVRLFHDVSQCFKSVSWCFTSVHDVLRCITMFDKCFMMFYYVLWCLLSRATTADTASATAWPPITSAIATTPQGVEEIFLIAEEIGDDAAGIVDIAAKVTPCWTPSWMETGVTLFLEDKFQRGRHWYFIILTLNMQSLWIIFKWQHKSESIIHWLLSSDYSQNRLETWGRFTATPNYGTLSMAKQRR